MKHLLLLILFFSLIAPISYAVVEQVAFKDQKTELRYKNLIAELRCLVCQNQNLADSDADLAKDLRRKTAEMLQSGATDKEVLNYMRERYGDFVLYRPPFNVKTALLWLGPFVLLLAVLIGIFLNIKRRQEDELLRPTRSKDEAQRVKVRNLLRDAPELDKKPDQKSGSRQNQPPNPLSHSDKG